MVICDTNVWYRIAAGGIKPQIGVVLTPTFLSLSEIATSTNMLNLPLYQSTVRAIYEKGSPIIPQDPFDYVLHNQYPQLDRKDDRIEEILRGFNQVLQMDISTLRPMDADFIGEVRSRCEASRKPLSDLAAFNNEELHRIRQNIFNGEGRKAHLKKDAIEGATMVTIHFLTTYVEERGYDIDLSSFNWGEIDLFICATENFFKKLETTPKMKMKQNDIIDWFNLLYVSPSDRYLTFDGPWRNYILNDPRISHYLYPME